MTTAVFVTALTETLPAGVLLAGLGPAALPWVLPVLLAPVLVVVLASRVHGFPARRPAPEADPPRRPDDGAPRHRGDGGGAPCRHADPATRRLGYSSPFATSVRTS
ncbi:hypothetical protein BJF83_17775 [Nocardiopsis sp. CNR-923]|uniref:hypothetical protein n=1 Tax=Nocardiopsis sp. CNR-923 TaxID=1904965 RepID=UPI00096951EB|nr:hypothetical protein [Nocardiopsis sp. CNR-923]OLT27704.1 hypothetical protein BJF83_17775 [Nocardiopsis sp. CNR-923]